MGEAAQIFYLLVAPLVLAVSLLYFFLNIRRISRLKAFFQTQLTRHLFYALGCLLLSNLLLAFALAWQSSGFFLAALGSVELTLYFFLSWSALEAQPSNFFRSSPATPPRPIVRPYIFSLGLITFAFQVFSFGLGDFNRYYFGDYFKAAQDDWLWASLIAGAIFLNFCWGLFYYENYSKLVKTDTPLAKFHYFALFVLVHLAGLFLIANAGQILAAWPFRSFQLYTFFNDLALLAAQAAIFWLGLRLLANKWLFARYKTWLIWRAGLYLHKLENFYQLAHQSFPATYRINPYNPKENSSKLAALLALTDGLSDIRVLLWQAHAILQKRADLANGPLCPGLTEVVIWKIYLHNPAKTATLINNLTDSYAPAEAVPYLKPQGTFQKARYFWRLNQALAHETPRSLEAVFGDLIPTLLKSDEIEEIRKNS